MRRLGILGLLSAALVLVAGAAPAAPPPTPSSVSPLTGRAAMTASAPAAARGASPLGAVSPAPATPRLSATATIASTAFDAGATAEPAAAATSSAMASVAPVVTAAALAGGRHADPQLEALLPTRLGGVALTIESQAGTELATNSAAFDAFLAGLGRTRADFSLASAYSQGGLKAEVGAWRVRGADPARLVPGLKKAVQASSTTPLTVARETVAGRAVTRIGDPGQLTQGPLYVFVRGDTLLFVQTPERALAEEAMTKLPR